MSPLKSQSTGRMAITLFAISLATAACDTTPSNGTDANLQNAVVVAPLPVRTPVVPAPLPNLGRSDLVAAAEAAASAYALAQASEGTDPLVGRSFAIRVPFGCSGATVDPAVAGDNAGLAGWTWGPDRKTIEISMTPGDWLNSALIAGGQAPTGWEAVEGFWVPRPWLTSDACPKVRRDPLQPATSASGQTLGIAAVFETDGSRIGRRNGRAYAFTVRAEGDAELTPPTDGYRMLLAGRIVAFPDGRATRCRASGPDDRPVCVIATTLDRVAFEDAGGKMLSEWRPG